MSGIQIKTNLKDIQKRFGVKSQKQFLKITQDTINHTAELVVNVQRNQIFKKVDRPKPFSVKGVVMSKFAKPTKTGLSATVIIKDTTADYIKYLYYGTKEYGKNGDKASPVGDGWERRDKFGGILVKKKGLKPMLNKTPAKRKYRKGSRFIGKPNGSQTSGVWERTGKGGDGGLKLLVAFTPFINHKKILSWEELNIKVVKNNMYKEFNKQWQKRIGRKGSI